MSTARRLAELAGSYVGYADDVGAASLVIDAKGAGFEIDRTEARALIEHERTRRNGKGAGAEPDFLFDPAAIRFGRFLDSEPPPRRMQVEHFLPLEVVGLLASMGGVGKSYVLYQLAVSAATGAAFLGMRMEEVGAVLHVAGEDDETELHRRGRRILEHYEAAGPIDRGALSERLHVVSRVSDPNLLTAGREGEVERTRLADQLIASACRIPDLKLITLDPVSRFRGGRANSEEDTTRFVEVLEAVKAATGATVLAAVHVNKASIRDGGDADQSIVRGSSALVDGVRWCATMQRLRRDAAAEYGVEAAEADRYVRLDLVKANYVAPWPGMWLRREAGGVLVPCVLEREPPRGVKATTRYDDVLDRLRELIASKGALTRNALERDYAGRDGVLGVGKETLRAILARAVEAGDLLETEDQGGRRARLLSVPQ